MERLGERDRLLLGCAYRDPFGNLHHPPPPHHRNSDVDFADVFGGPPKRSSFFERRRSRADSFDSRARPRPLSAEKPAFGELGSPARRRLLSDDFYDDIFPGSDSGSSTPRKLDRDPFPSTPGSRVLSPNRPVFVGGSSLPQQLSFPSTKLAKGVDKEDGDFDVSSFPYSPNAFRAGACPAPDDPRNYAHAFHRQSPLATELSRGKFRSSETLSKGSQSERYATSIEGYISSNQFHFSIHKWAGKGVSLSLSSRSKDTNGVNRYSRLPEVVIHTDDLPSDDTDDDEMSISTGLSNNQTNHSNKVLNEIFMENKHEADSTNPEEVLHEIDQNNLRKTYTGNSGTSVMNTAEVSAALPDIKRPELKNLHQIFKDELGKDGSKELNKHAKAGGGQQDAANDVKVKNQAQRQNFVEHGDTISASMKNIPVSLEEKMQGSRVKGKVKDFIKIFNVEGSPKRKGIFEGGDRKSKEKDRVKGKVEIQVNTSAAKSNEEVKVATAFNETFGIDPVEVDEILKRGGVPTLYMSSNIPLTNDSSSERNETQGPCSASTHESVKTYDSNVEESNFEDFDGCLVEQLSQEQTENQRLGLPEDQIQIANVKIREWSKGKEGNIRSLLSTLQYVLWSDSGWKPVPLVDIIEGNSVKRAYQRALLYLHPDKLQQRGAAEQQKYIAEKVFDILQEAWDQFNSASNSF